MKDEFDLDGLKAIKPPRPDVDKRAIAMREALAAFDEEKNRTATQGSGAGSRLMAILNRSWSTTMTTMTKGRLMSGTALGAILAVPLAGYIAFMVISDGVWPGASGSGTMQFAADEARREGIASQSDDVMALPGSKPMPRMEEQESRLALSEVAPPPAPAMAPAAYAKRSLVGDASMQLSPGVERLVRDRIENFETNGIRSVLQDPVSTFSIDVDTASYALIRRALMEGRLPDPETVRVEELVNYFSYDYPLPETRETPFGVNVAVAQTPWNADTKLVHIGIQGFDIEPETRPAANLVFLIDVSGSMNEPDKLPLLKNAFRLLLDRLDERDTISIVTYAGNAGTVLEPTKASERETILEAIDGLEPGGTTAGAAGIEEAYRLARKAKVDGGVNRVMLATDGDFNVGASSDAELKRMIEERRDDGIFLSVFGFGKGNYNDQLMQVLAQNGNGTAAYIDTLAEAQRTLVEEAGSTLFPIAKDVKIQVEFNPATVAEYRLIGYETRALKREDFNNDRVDAGDIGSGHSVTAIYEITPVGSPAVQNDPLRYGDKDVATAAGDASGEYAFLKLRYKLPDETNSHLVTTPIGPELDQGALAGLSTDARFSIAVAAFGQKLRETDAVADYSWDEIRDLAASARGDDPYGYRSEFLRLVGLAEALDR